MTAIPVRVAALSIVMALFMALSPDARAQGYWACVGEAWQAVGKPRHPKPGRDCNSRLAMPDTRPACEAAGGEWGPAGIFPTPICRMPTHDGGVACADSGECEGLCLAAPTALQLAALRERKTLKLMGTCSSKIPVFGCMAEVKKGYVKGLICRD